MLGNRPPAITIPEHADISRPGRYFAKATGQSFNALTDGGAFRIDLYDEIGVGGVTAKDFRAELKRADDSDIVLRVNSPGGSVFDGLAIYNDLVTHPGKVRVEVTGVAASIASVIAMAGDTRAIASNAFMMVHNAWGITVGNARGHDEAARVLRQIDLVLVDTYSARSGQDPRTTKRLMDAETWFTGKEAIDSGFATELLSASHSEPKARFDLSIFTNAPAELRTPFGPGNRSSDFASDERELAAFIAAHATRLNQFKEMNFEQ